MLNPLHNLYKTINMQYEIYPGSSPEFRMFQKSNGNTSMQIRYINRQMGYTSKWLTVPTEKEETTKE